MPDLVFTFSVETWADACRRQLTMPSDRLAAGLLTRPELGRVMVADPFRSLPLRLARRAAGRPEPPFPARAPDRQVLVRPAALRRDDPTGVPALERSYARYTRHLQAAAGRLGMEQPAIVTTNPFVAAFGDLDWAGPVTFYAWDDWSAHPAHQRLAPAYKVAYERIRRLGRRVCAVSDVLLERLAPTGPAAIVPNGIDPTEWERPALAPSWFEALPAPRFLYIGSLDGRLDTGAVADVAGRYPDGTVVLLGPVADTAAIEPLRSVANVRIRPPAGRDVVASLVSRADVCLMPHRRTALTEAMSPLKLYEYVAGGRPVVATDLPPVRAVDARVVLVAVGGDFAAGVAEALARGPASEADRAAFLSANSWARRHDRILEVALA